MAQFQFTIPASITGSSDLDVMTDRGMAKNIVPRVLVSQFGDGYEQRVNDGVNPNNQKFSVSFRNRDSATIYNIAEFFDENVGKAFTFTVTDKSGDTDLKVVCEEYNIIYISEFFHSLDATLRRVYEP